jgi:4-hydroxy-3-polyprenylbenzoate decarboxylase
MKKLIVGMTGASGVQLGCRLLEALKSMDDVETHLIISDGAECTLRAECGKTREEIERNADYVYLNYDIGAAIASGSFYTEGMVVLPCSMKTLSGIAHAYDENLIIRAADVCMKECRKVVLVPRETPLNLIHLENMERCARAGCVIMPPVFTYYNHSESMEDQADHLIGKILMQFAIKYENFRAWKGQ